MTIRPSARLARTGRSHRAPAVLALVGAVIATILATSMARGQAVTTRPATSRPATTDLHGLLVQRRDACMRIEQILRQEASLGSASPAELHEAHVDRLQAELDLAEDEATHGRIANAILEAMRAEESRVVAAVRVGQAREVDALRARVDRLEVEIDFRWFEEEDGEDEDEYDDDR